MAQIVKMKFFYVRAASSSNKCVLDSACRDAWKHLATDAAWERLQ